MVGIEHPARELTKGLFSTWRKLSKLQPVTDLFLKEVRSKDLSEQEVPVLSKNVHSLWVMDSELPAAFWRNILHQLIGCPQLQLDRVFLLLLPNVMERRSLLVVYVFNFYQTLQVVPHGTKGTGPRFIMRPVYLRSQLRNNTNTVSTLILLIHLLHVLCTRYTGIAHHRALQTSG